MSWSYRSLARAMACGLASDGGSGTQVSIVLAKVSTSEESLLTPDNAGDVPRNAIKPSRYSLFRSGLFPPSVQLVPYRRADERTGARVAPRLRGLLDLMLVFSAETDGNSGAPGCS